MLMYTQAYGVEGVAHPLAKRGVTDASSAEAAKSFLEEKLGIKADALSHKGGHASETASFEYFRQSLVCNLFIEVGWGLS
jgi:hypothetical protein